MEEECVVFKLMSLRYLASTTILYLIVQPNHQESKKEQRYANLLKYHAFHTPYVRHILKMQLDNEGLCGLGKHIYYLHRYVSPRCLFLEMQQKMPAGTMLIKLTQAHQYKYPGYPDLRCTLELECKEPWFECIHHYHSTLEQGKFPHQNPTLKFEF